MTTSVFFAISSSTGLSSCCANLAMVDLCHWGWRETPTHITNFSSLQHCNTRPRSQHVVSLENSESPTVRFYSTQIDEMPMNVADLI